MHRRWDGSALLQSRCSVRIAASETWIVLNRLQSAGITVYRVSKIDALTAALSIGKPDMEAAEAIIKQCGGTVEILKVSGPAGWFRRMRNRAAMLVAAAVCSLIVSTSSLFVWEVRVEENTSGVTDEKILAALADNGLKAGCFSPLLSLDGIRSGSLAELPGVSYLGLQVRGSRAIVSAREEVPVPALRDETIPADVIAEVSGVITSVTVLEGAPLVRRGEAVRAGQTLISSVRGAGTGAERHVHAMGEVTAYTYYELTCVSSPVTVLENASNRTKRRVSGYFGGREINFYNSSRNAMPDCGMIAMEYWVPFSKAASTPLCIALRRIKICSGEGETSSERESFAGMEKELLRRLRQHLGENGRILSASFSRSDGGGVLYVTLRAECEQRIDCEVPHT